MKTFFILLLLTNIVFALMQWLLPYEQLFAGKTPQVAAEKLRLLSEAEGQSDEQIPITSIESEDGSVPNVSKKLCYTLGPFKEKELVQQVIQKFEQNKLELKSRPSQEKEYLGMMVYIDGHKSREQARLTAASLAKKGVRDYIIINEDGKANALSLGVFGLKKNAERRLSRIKKLGYDVKSEARYRMRTIFWLDYNQSENAALQRLIDRLKAEYGVSRISRLCN